MNTALWLSNLAFWAGQVALLVTAAAFLPRLLQIRQPRVLLGYWRALLAISLALPLLQPWHRPQAFGAITITAADPGAVVTSPDAVASFWRLPSFHLIAQVAGTIILVGIGARFIILALGLLKLRHLRRVSSSISSFPETAALLEQLRFDLKTRADFLLSSDVHSPVTFGFARPMILLPESFPSMDSRFQIAIASHELLHVRRRDWAHHFAEEIIRACFWFHPAIAWLVARMRLAREQVVDHEVVMLTNARKTYLEALLEFTTRRSPAAAVLAPPFLVERQLAERIALMLKEVRMSRTRLIASLIVASCCVVFVVALAARTFPLKGAPVVAQSKPTGGVTGGIVGGVSGGIAGGVTGGMNGQSEASVERNSIWMDTVKRGPMLRQVRGLGTIVPGEGSGKFVARVTLPASMTADVRPGQNATVEARAAYREGNFALVGQVKGHVLQVNGSSGDETRTIDVALDGRLPEGVGVDLAVEATIEIEKLEDVLYVGRPIHTTENSSGSLFKIVDGGTAAERVNVRFGRASVKTIEVLDGLRVGDTVILSDMSEWDKFDRVHLK